MALKLSAPLERDFTLDKSDETYANTGEPTRVTIRQATQAASERRAAVFAEVTRVIESGELFGDQSIKIRQRWSMEELKRIEVYLTLIGCNIEDEKGKQLFKFRSRSSRQEMDMNELDFARAWGSLPPDVAQEIHEKVLEVNYTWGAEGER